MNKERRNKIYEIANKIEFIKEDLRSILNMEQNVFENMPENLQSSMRGIESEETCDILDEIVDSLEDAIDNMRNI